MIIGYLRENKIFIYLSFFFTTISFAYTLSSVEALFIRLVLSVSFLYFWCNLGYVLWRCNFKKGMRHIKKKKKKNVNINKFREGLRAGFKACMQESPGTLREDWRPLTEHNFS